MNKLLILFIFLFNSIAYGCAMCATTVPKVNVYTTVTAKKNSTNFDIQWKFHEAFNEALKPYDTNDNGTFEKKERDNILQSIVIYVKPIHYLTNLEFLHKNKPFEEYFIEPIKTNFEKLFFEDNKEMVFHYNFDLDFVLQKDHKLSISFYDGGGNFDFNLKDVVLKDYTEFKAIVPKFYETFIFFYEEFENDIKNKQEKEIPDILQPQNLNEKELTKLTETANQQEITLMDLLSEELTQIKLKLEAILQDIKDNNTISSYVWLLFFSFIYGVLHAVGPGHGKSLVASYFINQNKSYFKAFSISALIGVVHTFSAFILTLIVYYVIGLIFSSALVDIEQMATKVSAIIIIAIALYLIYKKYIKTTQKIQFHTIENDSLIKTTPNMHKPTSDCGCSGCQTTTTDLGVILAAGIIPCPGTVTIFLFTMGLGIYFVGFLSAVFMSIGMSLVIYFTALASLKFRKSTSNNTTLVKILEYGSLVFILFLGLILLLV